MRSVMMWILLFMKQQKPDRSQCNVRIGPIEHGEGIAPKHEMEKINHIAIKQIIERIAEGPHSDEPKTPLGYPTRLGIEEIHHQTDNDDHPQAKKPPRISLQNAPSSARIPHSIER